MALANVLAVPLVNLFQPPYQIAMNIKKGILLSARQSASPHFNARPPNSEISLLVIHNISLPPGEFGGPHIEDFFRGNLQAEEHPFFKEIADNRVSAHLLIRRDGEVIQFVNFNMRAWHAGESSHRSRPNCNDYSIGIELEGTDIEPYTSQQYKRLTEITQSLIHAYKLLTKDNICGHSEIAPTRKTDPGASFEWKRYKGCL